MSRKKTLLDENDFKIDDEMNVDDIKEDDSKNLVKEDIQEVENEEYKEDKKSYNFPLRFEDDNYIYISLMSDMERVSMNKFINKLIEKDKKENKEKYDKLKEIERLRHKMMNEL